MRGPSSCQWPAWPCPRREVTDQTTVEVTRSRLLQRVQRSKASVRLATVKDTRDGCGVKESTCSYESWTSDCCAVIHGERWKQPRQERLMQQPLDVFQVTASDFGLERRSSVEGGQQDSLESIVSFVAV